MTDRIESLMRSNKSLQTILFEAPPFWYSLSDPGWINTGSPYSTKHCNIEANRMRNLTNIKILYKSNTPSTYLAPPPMGTKIIEAHRNNRNGNTVSFQCRIGNQGDSHLQWQEIRSIVTATLGEYPKDSTNGQSIEDFFKNEFREQILATGVRSDGRLLTDIREISVETGILPRTHGSAQ